MRTPVSKMVHDGKGNIGIETKYYHLKKIDDNLILLYNKNRDVIF